MWNVVIKQKLKLSSFLIWNLTLIFDNMDGCGFGNLVYCDCLPRWSFINCHFVRGGISMLIHQPKGENALGINMSAICIVKGCKEG